MPNTKQPTIDLDNLDLNAGYSVKQAAGTIGYNSEYLRRLIRLGRVQAFRPNGYGWRILGSEIQRMINNLDLNGGLLPPAKSKQDDVQVIEVSPEQMRLIDPNWPG